MFRRSAPTKDGTFTFAGVPPGPYAVLAQAQPPMRPAGPSLPPAGPPRPSHWARADVVVDGQDIVDVSLALRPGLTVAGRIQFEGTSAPPPDLSRIRISMIPVQAQGEVSLGQAQIQPDAAGAFTIHGLTPGRYRLMANVPSARPDANPWQLKSSVVQGRETVDMPIDLRDGAEDAVITFTDRVSELSGLVQDAGGQPAPEYHIVLFARDKAYWTPTSRRLRTVRPAADGKYVIANLPPGDYLMTAVTDMEQGEQFDPAFLEVLSRSAIAVAIAEGEKKTQDLRLNRVRAGRHTTSSQDRRDRALCLVPHNRLLRRQRFSSFQLATNQLGGGLREKQKTRRRRPEVARIPRRGHQAGFRVLAIRQQHVTNLVSDRHRQNLVKTGGETGRGAFHTTPEHVGPGPALAGGALRVSQD